MQTDGLIFRELVKWGFPRHFAALFSIATLAMLVACALDQPGAGIETAAGRDAGWRIDHAVIVVDNLAAAIDRFRAEGFKVIPGGAHGDGATENALIPFADGSYLELFASVDPKMAEKMRNLLLSGGFDSAITGLDAMSKRFMLHLARGAGLRDFAVSRSGLDLARAATAAGRKGAALTGPIPMSRIRPDDRIVRWRVAVPIFPEAEAAPFLIADDTPRDLRVPGGEATRHPNGALGIERIVIAAQDPGAVIRWYDAVFPPRSSPSSAITARYHFIGSVVIVRGLVGAEREGPAELFLRTARGARQLRLP